MFDRAISLDNLERRFPFLTWPRVTVDQAKFYFPDRDDRNLEEREPFNLTQVFITNDYHGDPMVTLLKHLSAIEYQLRFGLRREILEPGGGATFTGGLLWWAERGVTSTHPTLALFRRRGLTWVRPTTDPIYPGYWLSDVGLSL